MEAGFNGHTLAVFTACAPCGAICWLLLALFLCAHRDMGCEALDRLNRFMFLPVAVVWVGFIASELLLAAEGGERFVPRADRAVILFNRNTSLHADRSFQATIADAEDFYPSPSVFVYTLPNIVTGEIAIRNKSHGESEFILLPEKSETAMNQAVERALMDKETASVLAGWVEALSEEEYEAEMELVSS